MKYRDGKKVVSQYIRKQDVDTLRQQIEKRRHIETMIKSLREEQKLAECSVLHTLFSWSPDKRANIGSSENQEAV